MEISEFFASIYYGSLGLTSLLLKPFLVLLLIIVLAFLILLVGKFLKKAFGVVGVYLIIGIFILLSVSSVMALPTNITLSDGFECGAINCNPTNWTTNWTLFSASAEIRTDDTPIGTYHLRVKDTSYAERFFNNSYADNYSWIRFNIRGEDMTIAENVTLYYYNGTAYHLLTRITDLINDTDTYLFQQFNVRSLGVSSNSSLRLVKNTGGKEGYIDNITITNDFCVPLWVANYTLCNLSDSKIKYYYDSNECGKVSGLPIDNGTISSCDYCNSSFVANYTSCNISDSRVKYYYNSASCCALTNLSSDCTPPVDNGTISSCDYCMPVWNCVHYANTCPSMNTFLQCDVVNDTHIPSCCSQTNLTSDCVVNASVFDKPCGNLTRYLNVLTYPYVAVNTTYPMEYITFIDGVRSYIQPMQISIWNGVINETFNMTFDNSSQSYKISFSFTAEGDYPFTIYSTYPYNYNLDGELLVRVPFNITFCAYEIKDQIITGRYENDFAYLIAEFTDEKPYYYPTLEQFITPLGFKMTYKTPVFHTLYRDGCGTFTLYEKNTDYGIRLFDGQATFLTTFSSPNISKTYGANILFGKYTFNGTDSYNVYLSSKDIHQYTWLANWIYIILLILCVVGSVFLFFMFPDKPSISMALGLGFTIMLTIIRVGVYLFKGW